MIGSRQRQLLQTLWAEGPLSRWELHERTGVRPNTVGADSAYLIEEGILREGEPTSKPRKGKAGGNKKTRVRGRPRVPLQIDPQQRQLIGLAIRPGHISAARLNLLGELIAPVVEKPITDAGRLIRAARDLLQSQLQPTTLSVGVSTPGFVDTEHHAILLSSAWPGQGDVNLQPIYEAAGETPYLVENDMHALAARWLLTHRAEHSDDVLLVYFDDGQLGAALLINGRPNRGCVTAANELGHTRLPVDTERCYCGHIGCLERICSTDFLKRSGDDEGDFRERAAGFDESDEAMSRVIELLALGISNAINFSRVNRLVLVSELTRHAAFAEALVDSVRGQMLAELATRVQIDLWDQPASEAAETAGWLAMASLYLEGWLQENQKEVVEEEAA